MRAGAVTRKDSARSIAWRWGYPLTVWFIQDAAAIFAELIDLLERPLFERLPPLRYKEMRNVLDGIVQCAASAAHHLPDGMGSEM